VLRLKVLGGLSVDRDGRPLSGALAQPRRLAVLAMLARGGRSGVSRDNVINTLWPDTDEERARHTLSQTLYALRRELGRDEFIVGVRELRLDTELLAIDVAQFQDAIAAHDHERAVTLYEGRFLDGFHLPAIDEFGRWVERERALLERTYAEALERLARDATGRNDHARATLWWRKRAARDPLDARVAIALMRSLAAGGDRVAAIQHARVHEVLIAEELSLPADRDVLRLAEELRREQIAAAADPAPVNASGGTPEPLTVASKAGDDLASQSPPEPVVRSRIATPRAQAGNAAVRPRSPAEWRIQRRTAFVLAAALVGVLVLGTRISRSDGAVPNAFAASAADVDRPARPADDVTTRSVIAYRLYQSGLRAHYHGDVAAARSLFDAAVAEDSLFPLAQYYSAVVTRDQAESLRRLERARRLARRATDRERLTIMAGWAGAMAPAAHRAIAETLAIRYPTELTGYLNLGVALVSDGEYIAALRPLSRVLELDSLALRDPSAQCAACGALHWMVRAYLLADSLAAAERVARRWVRLEPRSPAAVSAFVEVLDVQGRGATGDSLIRATGARVLETADALYRRAANLIRAGDYEAAQRLLLDVIETGGTYEQIDAYWLLAIALRDQGRLAEALDVTRRLRALVPRAPRGVAGSAPSQATLEAQLLLELGQPRLAAALFDSIARGREELDSDASAARRAAWNFTHSAGARAAAGDTAGVRRLIDSVQSLGLASGLGRDRRLYHHVRGLWLAAQGDDEGAVVEFRRSILSRNFGYTRTNYELARALLRLGRPAEAVAALQPALRGSVDESNLYVTRSELHELLAEAWAAAGRLDSAGVHYRMVAAAWRRADPALRLRWEHARDRVR
jgi:DNA-binding SARP family transcriptional activator/tetratricopeptide (TPR) repeat protein